MEAEVHTPGKLSIKLDDPQCSHLSKSSSVALTQLTMRLTFLLLLLLALVLISECARKPKPPKGKKPSKGKKPPGKKPPGKKPPGKKPPAKKPGKPKPPAGKPKPPAINYARYYVYNNFERLDAT